MFVFTLMLCPGRRNGWQAKCAAEAGYSRNRLAQGVAFDQLFAVLNR